MHVWVGRIVLLKFSRKWKTLESYGLKNSFQHPYWSNWIFVNTIQVGISRIKCKRFFCLHTSQIPTLYFWKHPKCLPTLQWIRRTVLPEIVMKTRFWTKMNKPSFCQHIRLCKSWMKKCNPFLSTQLQITNSELFGTFKLFKKGSVSSENHSF